MANNKTFYKEGLYVCEVTDQALTKSSTGNFQFILQVKVLAMRAQDGQFYDLEQQYQRSMYRALTEKTIDYAVEDLQVLGFAGSSWAQLDPSTPNYQSFAGQEVQMVCKHEEYEGSIRERWSIARPGGGGGALEVKPLEPAEKRQLDALFGRALKGFKDVRIPRATELPEPRGSGLRAPNSASPHSGPAVITDDDVPF